MKKIPLLLGLIILGLLWGCEKSILNTRINSNSSLYGLGEEPDDCLGLPENDYFLNIQEQFTTLPGKVSVLLRTSALDGSPVSGLQATDFSLYEQGQNDDCFNPISSSESFARISPNTQVFSNNTLLVLDLSNSVLEGSLEELKSAASSFLNQVLPEQETESVQMAIYWFDGEDRLHLLQEATSSKVELTAAIEGIEPGISEDPSTDLYGAVIKSTEIAEELIAANLQQSFVTAASIVLFTDGTDQASRYTEQTALRYVDQADPNISFYTIGLGAEIEIDVLSAIGKTFSVIAQDKEELETTFTAISDRVSEAANSFYLLEYCSPKRDGSGFNNLVIQLQLDGAQGAVQTSFDATDFSGGCQ